MMNFSIEQQRHSVSNNGPGTRRCWNATIDLFNQNLGFGYLTEEAVNRFFRDHEHAGLYAAVTDSGPLPCIGAVLIAILSRAEREAYGKTLGKAANGLLIKYRRVGFIKALVVDSNRRRQGVGKALTLYALQQFKRWDCEAIFTIAWLPADERISSLPLFEKLNFSLLAIKNNYWNRSSVIENFQCPACGGPPCRCAAAFLFYVLNNHS
jgi:GNAT superfamily N-acetyltransferase